MREKLEARVKEAVAQFFQGFPQASDLDAHVYVSLIDSEEERRYQSLLKKHSSAVRKWALAQSHEVLAERFLRLWLAKHSASRDDDVSFALVEYLSSYRNVLRERVAAHAQARKKGAMAKLQRDPKQLAKDSVRKMWAQWRAGRATHRSVAAFARVALDQHECLQSQPVVERWVREWDAESARSK